MNVLTAWESCVNGTGVTVGVVDNGIQDHADLNIDRNLDAGYTNKSKQGNPTRSRQSFWTRPMSAATRRRQHQASLKHGTRVAGIVAAKKNGQGTIGIAFGATLVDVRIASTSVIKTFNASLLKHKSDVIDVYSCNLANFHTGKKTYPLTANQEKAFQEGTTYGRQGRGSVYVSTTGNSGAKRKNLFRDSCAYDRLVTNRYVISVAGIQHNLRKVPNGKACSAMMVAAFTTKPGVKKNPRVKVITTTDIVNKTTRHFNQNSAAAPMVSGAVALALSANSFLTYRDIMHLLVNTARSDLVNNKNKNKFLTNAAGFNVSSYFGFGLLDIGALVERSKTWELVPDRQSCHSTEVVDNPMSDDDNYLVVKVSGCNVTYVEHVEVSLIVTHQHVGHIQWTLVSPNRTKSIILPGRFLDQTTTMNLTVLTVQMWGENPEGYWKLKPKPMFGKTLNKGTVRSVKLLIHGYNCGNKCKLQPAQQDLVNWKKWSRLSECTVSCGNKTRSRHCNDNNNQKYCSGKNFETVPCDQSECKDKEISEVQSGECPLPSLLISRCVEQCSDDSDCSVKQKCCNNGCGHTCETSLANIWSDWSQWSQCTVTCGSGNSVRQRQCSTGTCSGDTSQTDQCFTKCPPNNIWGEWSQWSECVRERQCTGTCSGTRCEIKNNCSPNCSADRRRFKRSLGIVECNGERPKVVFGIDIGESCNYLKMCGRSIEYVNGLAVLADCCNVQITSPRVYQCICCPWASVINLSGTECHCTKLSYVRQ
ncbi:neuroendocrine convertase 2-like [Mytilus trossulus]|uniref:neuroendocrine convertase 2-like n=1 Tax=Mytilus trossulus TaxID=6551 RepID=UPI00300761AD